MPADLVVAGIGVTPDVDLARAAGLAVDNGIVVDEHLRSSAPDVCAAGDVANAYHPFAGRHVRVEHWANALHQPVVAAQAMLGKDAVYDRLPYFFTDQYDLGMEYTGFGGGEVVVRGDERRVRRVLAAGRSAHGGDERQRLDGRARDRAQAHPLGHPAGRRRARRSRGAPGGCGRMSDDEPGDAVCWLPQLCPECGAMPTGEHPERCWRCDAVLTPGDD